MSPITDSAVEKYVSSIAAPQRPLLRAHCLVTSRHSTESLKRPRLGHPTFAMSRRDMTTLLWTQIGVT